ncbi:hypothetical protein [Sulfitobacter faviae]|uniref:hypothetical protein n=1 Tax=Sulfitobacter faviae TaxID=1775881 RepID=UPI00398D1E2F
MSGAERKHYNFDLMLIQSQGSVPDGWGIYSWEVVNLHTPHEAIHLTGGVGRPIKKGKRKGRTTWRDMDPSTKMVFTFTRQQMAAFRKAWEAETGECSNCHGNGTECYGWSATEGERFRPCKACNATGKAPVDDDTPQGGAQEAAR